MTPKTLYVAYFGFFPTIYRFAIISQIDKTSLRV